MSHALVAFFTAVALCTEPAAPPTATTAPPVASEPAVAPTPAAAPAAESPPTPQSWDEVTSTTTTTTTTTTTGTTTGTVPPPVVTPTAVPPPPPRPRTPGASAMLGVGGGLLGIGAISLVFVAAPAALVKRGALRRANDEEALAFTPREDRYRRARNADNTMEAAFWVGVSALALGVVLVTAGAVLKARGPRVPRTAHRAGRSHVRLDGSGGGLRLRF